MIFRGGRRIETCYRCGRRWPDEPDYQVMYVWHDTHSGLKQKFMCAECAYGHPGMMIEAAQWRVVTREIEDNVFEHRITSSRATFWIDEKGSE